MTRIQDWSSKIRHNLRNPRKALGKFGNRRTYCASGHDHDSKIEAEYCDILKVLLKAGEIRSFEIQRSFDIVVNGRPICTHRVDFVVVPKDNGQIQVHEVKGVETDCWKMKYKLFRALYPTIEYNIIKKGDVLCQKKLIKNK